MSSSTTGFVPISKGDALRAAEAMIVAVNKRRQERRKQAITDLTATKHWVSWFRRRFWTRAEAEHIVDNHVSGSDMWHFRLWTYCGQGTKDLGHRLQRAAHLTQGDVWVNLDDVDIIASYLPSPNQP